MRRRHVAAILAAFLITALAGGNVFAGAPNASSSRPDWVEEGHSHTFDLADGARVHVLPPSTDRSQASAPGGAAAGALTGYGIDYHGGPVVPAESAVAIYWSASTIYAGGPGPDTTGAGSADGSLVGYFLTNLGGSPYYNINTTYADTVGSGHTVANSLAYTQYWADGAGAPSGSQNVSDAAIQAEITKGLTSGAIPWNPSTVYAVFSSGSVNLGGGFLTQYCAYHGYFTWGANTVLYAVMPYDNAGPGTCTALAAPNGDAAGDAEVNTLAHELEEANTDPQLNAWWNSSTGAENADQCAWNFGTRGLSGGQANITVGANNFLVQQNWLNASGGSCAQSYVPAASNFSIGASPTSLSLTQGGSGSSRISTAVATGSAGTVSLTVSGAPAGTSATLSPTAVTAGGSSTLSVVVGSSTTPGTYPLTITGVEGSATHSTAVSLTVTAATAGVPGAPTLSATRSNRRGVQLNWTVPPANGSTLTAYIIYRGTSAVSLAKLTQRTTGSTSYRDSSTTSGTVYYYAVSAVNAAGEGPKSNVASATAH